jgi:phosphohistidine phosphatase
MRFSATASRLSSNCVRLYLVRHAEAAPGEPDELRPLTAQGRDQARALGQRLLAEKARPTTVLTSPLLRACETGGELARALDVETEPHERLAPGAGVEDLRAAVEGHGEQVIVVGHQPDCGRITAELTGREPRFPPAGVAVLELD